MNEPSIAEARDEARLRPFLAKTYALVFGYGLAWLGWSVLIRPSHPGVQLVVSTAAAAGVGLGERILLAGMSAGGLLAFVWLYGARLKKNGGSIDRQAGPLGLFLLFHLPVCAALIAPLSRGLDWAPPETYRLPVLDKTPRGLPWTVDRVRVPDWSAPGEVQSVAVASKDWDGLAPGKSVVYVTTGPGFRGAAWCVAQTQAEFARHPKKGVRDLVPPAARRAASAPLSAFRRLRLEMTRAQVESLVGPPSATVDLGGVQMLRYDLDDGGSVEVFYDARDAETTGVVHAAARGTQDILLEPRALGRGGPTAPRKSP